MDNKITKCYRLCRLYSYVTHFLLPDGRKLCATFQGSQNSGIHGQFVTSDPELQMAMENSNAYRNGVFCLVATIGNEGVKDSVAYDNVVPLDKAVEAAETVRSKRNGGRSR